MIIPIETLNTGIHGNIVNVLVSNTEFLAKEFTMNKGTFLSNRAFREICMTMKVNHPNCVSNYGIVRSKNNIYLLLEKGDCDCFTLYNNNFFDNNDSIKTFLYDISKALKYLHDRNISHCDLSMKNIIKKQGVYKIIDFGNAIKGSRFDTYSDSTPYIMPYDNPSHIKVDIWALGCLSYLLFTKTLPFYGFDHVSQAIMISQMSGIDCDTTNKLDKSFSSDPLILKITNKMLNINSNTREIIYFNNEHDEHDESIAIDKGRLTNDSPIHYKLDLLFVIKSLNIQEIKMDNLFLVFLNLYKVHSATKNDYMVNGLYLLWLSLKLTTDKYYISDLCDWVYSVCGTRLENNNVMVILFELMESLDWSFDEITVLDFIKDMQEHSKLLMLRNSFYMCLSLTTSKIDESTKYMMLKKFVVDGEINNMAEDINYIKCELGLIELNKINLYIDELMCNKI